MECNGICHDDVGIYFKTVCPGSYVGVPHKIQLRNNHQNKLHRNICREPQNYAKIAFNNDPGVFEVDEDGTMVESVIDIRSAFFNVPILPEHRHKTLTLSPWGGSFIYNRLAFGLASGPSTWQKLLEFVLKDVKDCFIYLDDILCFSKSQEDHDKLLNV